LDDPKKTWASDFPELIHAIGPGRLKYRYTPKLIPWLRNNLSRFDAVVVYGIWQYHSFAVWRAAQATSVPYFVFVHGALDPWFKQTYPFKHLKKWLYWPWAEYRVLRDARCVLFTSENERLLARESFWLYRAEEAVVDYGIASPSGESRTQREQFFRAYPILRDKRLLLFLSRLHPKKGCDLLIEAFSKVAHKDPRLHLVMIGPDQIGWRASLEVQAARLGIDARITWTGMQTGNLKWGAFHAADVFVLPSHSENFGVVVAEALASGLPVLITDKVNIWRQIKEDGAAIVKPDTVDGTVSLLQAWLDLSTNEQSHMRERARACFEKRFAIRQTVRMLLDIIRARTGRSDDSSATEFPTTKNEKGA
jgi:glycosyltransferase involved in cell wall biosynthesis